MTIGKSAACSYRWSVGDRPKTMCRQTLRYDVPEAGNPLYLAFLIGRTKSTLRYAFSRLSAYHHFLSLCTDGEQSPPQPPARFAFSRRGPCVPSRSALGCRMLFIRFGCPSSPALSPPKGGSRQDIADIPPFRGPARGRSPRARISNLCSSPTCWLQHQR
jgi:hypothetical protein